MEKTLLQQVADGSEDAFRLLFDACYTGLFAYLFKMTQSRELTEDAIQDIFLKGWTKNVES